MPELLKVEGLKKHFKRSGKLLKAVDGASFTLQKGETLGLVGESGSGKSTLGRTILRLIEPDAGKVFFEGTELGNLNREALRQKRRDMQIVFQDPLASLNPRMTIGAAIEDPLIVHGMKGKAERQARVRDLMAIVGLDEAFENSFPYEFSGGQQQRVGIARALAMNPKFIVCDEPVSALDVSIQAQIIALLAKLREDFGLSYLFIAHDLGVIKYISDKIAVMYLGRIAQIGSKEAVFRRSAHPYTRALIEAVPSIPKDGVQKKRFDVLKGEIPSPIDLAPGCRFASRCPYVRERCALEEPELAEIERDHFVACHFPLD